MMPAWLDTREYPFTPHTLRVDGHTISYLDEGEGEVLLFVHGTPSWSFDFRNVIRSLRSSYRCIAPDHIGFGLSDKPQHWHYSSLNHAKNLEQLIRHLNLENITLVLHDFGGPIGFSAALAMPHRIRRVAIINSWLWSTRGEPDYESMKKILSGPILPFLYIYANFSARFILPRSFEKKKLSSHIHKHYTAPFNKRSLRHGPLGFARALVAEQDLFAELWQRRTELAALPYLFLWGMADPIVKPQHLETFRSGFPGATTVELPHCGHFPQEEDPDAVASALRSFIKTR